MKIIYTLSLLTIFVLSLSGCATIQKARRTDELERELLELKNKIADLEEEKSEELSDLEKAKEELVRSLKKEIGEYKAKLEMTERGLVITFLAEIFFDSGKDKLRDESNPILQKVAKVLNENVPDSFVAIEGHTDNEPIKYSGWKSNWELSSGRALSVLHYFVDYCQIKPERLSANGYGEFKSVSSNDMPEGRQKNRRVEIVILPSAISKIKGE